MVRRLVEEERFAPDATTSASASRRRSPPESAETGRSCIFQPENRNRPRRFWASGLRRPVALCVAAGRSALVELDLVLGEVGRITPCPKRQFPGDGLPLAEDRLQQRRLPGAVRADEGDVLAPLDRELDALQQRLVPAAISTPFDLGDRPAAALRLQELETEPLARRVRRAISPPARRAPSRAARSRVSFAWACWAMFFLYRKRSTKRSRRSMSTSIRCAAFDAAAAATPSRCASRARAPRSTSSGRPRARARRS